MMIIMMMDDDDEDDDEGTCDSWIGRVWVADDLLCGWQPWTCQRAVHTQSIPITVR